MRGHGQAPGRWEHSRSGGRRTHQQRWWIASACACALALALLATALALHQRSVPPERQRGDSAANAAPPDANAGAAVTGSVPPAEWEPGRDGHGRWR